MSKKARALELLLSGASVKEVSDGARCSERQVYRWLRDPDFTAPMREYDKATSVRLAGLEEQALTAMLSVMDEPEQAGASIKLRAARDILEIRLKWLADDFEERLTKIERWIDETQAKRN